VVVSEYVAVAHAFVDNDETGMVNAVRRAGEFDGARR
jgi:transcription termination factor NusB